MCVCALNCDVLHFDSPMKQTKPVIAGGQHVIWTQSHDSHLEFDIPMDPTVSISNKNNNNSSFGLEVCAWDWEIGNNDRLIGTSNIDLTMLIQNPSELFAFSAILLVKKTIC